MFYALFLSYIFFAVNVSFAQASAVQDFNNAQIYLNNVLATIVSDYPLARNDNTIRTYNIVDSAINPVASIKYGYANSDTPCSLSTSESYTPSEVGLQPCLASELTGKYIIQVRFKETSGGVVLPRTVANKYIIFVAHRLDNTFLSYDSSGSGSALNASIAYFSCYNPIILNYVGDSTVDYINNNMRAFGNIGEKGTVTTAQNPDSPYGGLSACLTAGASDVSLFT